MKLQHNKTDAGDAELPAEIARTGFCRAVAVKSAAAQEVRILLKARAHPVRQRRDTETAVPGLLGSLALRFPKGAGKPAGRVRTALEDRPDLRVMIEPLLSSAATLKREIGRLDEAVMARAKAAPACRLLMSVPGARAGHRAGPTAGHDFGDKRVPGAGQRLRECLTERPELDDQVSSIMTQ